MTRLDLHFKKIMDDIESLRKNLEKEATKEIKSLQMEGVAPIVGSAPPPPVDSFFGRQSELSILADYFLTSYGMRIAAIIGGPGMGKTALARKFLHDINKGKKPPYAEKRIRPHGIIYLSPRTTGISFERIFFDCARLLVQENTLRAVWNSKISTREKSRLLLREMQEGLYIILLDNFEDLLDSQGKIRDADIQEFFFGLCELKNKASLLITSNKPLALPGEIEVFYYPLRLETGLNFKDSKKLLQQFDPEDRLGLRDAPDEVMKQILKKVKGSPRALELLVSLLNHKPATKPENVPNLIPEGPYDRVVKELSEETFKQLTDEEKCIVQALAVFSRPVPIAAIQFLLFSFMPYLDISNIAVRLGCAHTITIEKNQETDLVWLSLHPMDQESTYKLIPLDESKEYNIRKLEHRAAEYYSKLRLERPWFRIVQLDPQFLEFAHRIKAKDFKGALQVIDTVDYSIQNHHKYLASLMALGLGNRAIEMRKQLKGKLYDQEMEAQNLTSMGWLCRRMGRADEAKALLKEAASISPHRTWLRVYALSELGYFLTDNANSHIEARKNLLIALKLARQLNNAYLEAHCLLGLAFVDFQRGLNESSLKLAINARDLFHSLKNYPYREIDCWVRMGMIYRKQMNYEDAVETALEGLKIAQLANLKDWEGELFSSLGFHYRGLGEYDKAIEAHKTALRLFMSSAGMKREEAVQQSYLANLYIDVGRLSVAEKAYDKAERIAEYVGLNRELSWIWGNRGILLRKKGQYREALELQEKGLNKIKDLHLDSSVIRYTDLAETYLSMEKYDQAQNQLKKALLVTARFLNQPIPHDAEFPELYLEAPYQEDALPQEMQSPGDHQRRGAILARTYLHSGDSENAYLVISHAREKDVIPHRHATATLHGLASFKLGRIKEATSLFQKALEYAEENIAKTNNHYEAHYAKGLALAGLGLIATNETYRLFNEAIGSYKIAHNICKEKGVVDEALLLLNELQSSANPEKAHLIESVRNVLVGKPY